MKLLGNRTFEQGLTGEEVLDTLVMIAENLENNLPEHITHLKFADDYLSSFIRSCVPWATYNQYKSEKHNPFHGIPFGKTVKKNEIKSMENILQFDNKARYDELSENDVLFAVPLFIGTNLLESKGYYERDYLPQHIKSKTFGLMPDSIAKQFGKFLESRLRKKGYKEHFEEQNRATQLLLKNPVILPGGVSLHGNVSGRDEDIFTYKDRYFLMSVWTPEDTSEEMIRQRAGYPALERYACDSYSLFFGGIIYPEKGTDPIAHFVAKHAKQNALPFLAPQLLQS